MTISLILLVGSVICLIVILRNLYIMEKQWKRMAKMWEKAREYESGELR